MLVNEDALWDLDDKSF